MDYKKLILFIAFVSLFFSAILGLNFFFTKQDNTQHEIEIFTSPTCPHCRNVKDYVNDNDLDEILDIGYKDTSKPENAALSQQYCEMDEEAYATGCGVPLMYDNSNGKILLGDANINDYLQEKADNFKKAEDENNLTADETIQEETSKASSTKVTLPAVIAGALADSFNPCAWSAILFLISTLLSLKASKTKLLKMGFAYIATIFVSYFLIGIGLFSFLSYISGWANIVYGILAGIIFIFALIELKDVFFYGKWISLQIPKSQWGRIEQLIKKATIPSALAVGFFVSILEFGCTGGVYLPIIAMLASKETVTMAYIYLLIYNLIFVLPLLIILILFGNGKTVAVIESFRQKHRKLMRLISGVVMIILAVIMILQIQ